MVIQSLDHLNKHDKELIENAVNYLSKTFIPDRHFVAAALRTKNGTIYNGFNIHTTLTKASICAEAIVFGEALRQGETDFSQLVCVASRRSELSTPFIVSSCGMCRELIRDYAPHCEIILADENNKIVKLNAHTLLPAAYQSIPI